MARCPADQLKDLEDVFKEIRKLESVQEKEVGIFYLKSKGFLHFHLKDGKRWADVRNGDDWGTQLNLPIRAPRSAKQRFLAEIKARHRKSMSLN
jgi:hypothetical protein